MRPSYPLVVFAIALALHSHAQPLATLQGRVIQPEGAGAFVNIQLSGTALGAVSNEQGRFSIARVPYGTYEIVASAVGYTTVRQVIEVNQPDITVILRQEEDIQSLGEVVITGTMREVSKSASPIPVEVYAPSLFRKNPTPNVYEALNMVNGVQPQMSCNVCNTGSIQINGLEGPYTMVLIDGMPIVSSLSTVYGLTGIPNSLVKRIEVVKGPASTLYGSEAVGGLINIITRDPGSAGRWQVDTYGTSVGEFNTDLSASFTSGKASSIIGINYFNYQVPRDINGDNFTDVTLQDRISVFNKWNLPLGQGRYASFAARYLYEDRWGGELQWSPALRGSEEVYGESIYTKRTELIGNVPLSRLHDVVLDLSYNHHQQNSFYGPTSYQGLQRVGFTQLRWNRQAGSHYLLIGMPYRYVFYDDNTPGTADAEGLNRPEVTHMPGIFVQDEWAVSSRITLLSGLRYDFNTIHGSIVTPRLSIKASLPKESVLRLTGGRGFRVVSLFTEDHAALTGARTVEIRDRLQPENSWNGNLNYMRTLTFRKGYVNFDAAAFYTYFTNKIVGDFLTDPDKIIYDNLNGYAVSQGVSLNTDASWTNGLKIMAGATWMQVFQVESDNGNRNKIPQVLAPRFSGTAAISYALPGESWIFDFTARVNGPMDMPVLPNDFRPARSPWVPLANLQITRSIHTLKSHWDIYAGVKNLFNFVQRNPLLHPDDPFDRPGGRYFDDDGNPRPDTNPFGYTFDVAYSYAPVQGLRVFAGIRYTLH